MHVVRDPLRAEDLPRGGVVTIGNFDGVHLGHRRILEAVELPGSPSGSSTFSRIPRRADHSAGEIIECSQKQDQA